MIDPAVPVVGIAVAGAMPSVAILSLRHQDARRWSSQLVSYRLEVPSTFNPSTVEPFLNTLTGLLPSRWERPMSVRGIGIEIVATADGIEHTLLVDEHQSDTVLGQARAALPGVRITLAPEYEPPTPTLAAELATARPGSQLRIDRPDEVSAGILAALQPLASDEQAIIQLLLFPVIVRSRTHAPGSAAVRTLSDVLFPKGRSASGQKAGELTDKQRLPQFVASLRLGVRTASPPRDRQLLGRLIASYHSANSFEAFLRRRQLPNRQIRRALARRRPPTLGYPCRLSTTELAGLIALPPKGVSLPGLHRSGSRLLAPASDIPTTGLVIGDSNFPGVVRPVAMSPKGFLQHALITGPPGVGKSWLLANVIVLAMEAGYGVIVIDPKSDLITDVVDRVPVHRQSDVTIISPLEDRVVGINLLQSNDDPDLAAEQLYAVIHRLNKDSWGPRLGDLLRAALHSLAQTEKATLVDLVPLLTDANYRQRIVGGLDDPLGLGSLWAWFNGLSETERSGAIAPILNKVRPWVVRPRLRHILGQAEPLLDMDEALADGRIVLVPLSSGELGADAAQLLGAVVMAKVTQSVMRRVRLPQSQRRPVLLVVDEAQMLGTLPTPIPELMAVSRAMSTGILAAHQHLGQFDSELRDALLGTARSRITFQTTAIDANRFARDLTPHLGAEDLQNLPAFEAVATLATGSRVAPPTTIRTRPLPPGNGQGEVVRELSRRRWGRDRDEVESELRRRQEHPVDDGSVRRQRRAS